MLARRELIMGFGHRVYTRVDPRNAVNKRMSKRLVGARVRAARGQQAHPPGGGVHRTRPQAPGTAGRPELTRG